MVGVVTVLVDWVRFWRHCTRALRARFPRPRASLARTRGSTVGGRLFRSWRAWSSAARAAAQAPVLTAAATLSKAVLHGPACALDISPLPLDPQDINKTGANPRGPAWPRRTAVR